ncbi:hypothetical protein K3495_g3506 [Podosphaera aphanis]|nr:hypothetical protein K3495_g3506 [Podosphaera aphanis]
MTTVTRSNTSMIAYYSSLDKATQEEKDFAKNNGYCLRIQRTNTAGNKTYRLTVLQKYHIFERKLPLRLQISRAPEAENMWSSRVTNPNHNRKAVDPQAQRAAIHLLLNTLSNRFRSKSNQPSEPAAVVSVISVATTLELAL